MSGCIGGRGGRKRYFVGQKAYLEVGLEDGHSDIKRSDLVCKALRNGRLSDDFDSTDGRPWGHFSGAHKNFGNSKG